MIIENPARASSDDCPLAKFDLPRLPIADPKPGQYRTGIYLPSEILARKDKFRRSAMRDLVHSFRRACGQESGNGAARTDPYLGLVEKFARGVWKIMPGHSPIKLDQHAHGMLEKEFELIVYLTSRKGFVETEGAGRMRRYFNSAESGSELHMLRKELLAACVWRLTMPEQTGPFCQHTNGEYRLEHRL